MKQNIKERIAWTISILVALFLVFAIAWKLEDPDQRLDRYRRTAYTTAVSCSGTATPRVTYEQITWDVLEGNSLRYEAADGVAHFAGFADTATNTITMPYTRRNERWIMVHEVLHLLGYIGHPDHPFTTCRAMPDHNK